MPSSYAHILRSFCAGSLTILLTIWSCCGLWLNRLASAQDRTPPAAQEPELSRVSTSDALHNVWRLSPRILSGSEPHGEAAFEELARLGVKTIVSVDGVAPQVDLAKKHGIRVIHIPIGYDAVHTAAQQQLVRVAREVTGTIYVHCHHGKHRGPAGAAVLCRADDGRSATAARKILEAAGTGKEYPGLWRDVEQFELPPSDARLPDLSEKITTPTTAAAMAELDRSFDRVKLLAAADWKTPPEHRDLSAAHETTLLLEHFMESLRQLPADSSDELRRDLKAAVNLAESLNKELRRTQPDSGTAHQLFKQLQTSCTQCHVKFRNGAQ